MNHPFAVNRIEPKHRWPNRWYLIVLVASLSLPRASLAADPLQYNRDVRPILAENCFACHGADSAAREADLRIDKREATIDSGVLVPGEPDDSELLHRIETEDADLVMPPPETKKRLTEAQKAVLRQWIAEGADYQPHWSFIAPRKQPPPPVARADWIKNPIDRFVLARLEAEGLEPAPQADPRVLFRRLHLDITGLPPSPEDVESFVTDFGQQPETAMSDWIDRLMADPAWGEHRARYWLDAARYGDTHGLHFDNYREMWPYRDWVIRAFNANLPFDQFIVQQIAGDLLEDPTEDQLVATGFQRCNITTNEGGTIDEENLANYAVDRVQTFGWVMLGLTTNCAQCHDHKFDPFTMKDFYSLAAFFRNTTQGPKDGNAKDGRGPVLVLPAESDRDRWEQLPGEIAAAIAQRDERRKAARQEFKQWAESTSVQDLEDRLANDRLILHVPLNEGHGKSFGAFVGEERELRELPTDAEVQWAADGKFGSAPIVTAKNTIEVGDVADFEKDGSFSYGAWVKTSNATTSAAILARMDEAASFRGWDLWQNGNSFSVHLIDAWPDNSIKVTTRGRVVKPGVWQHVFATYDGSGKPSGVRIFVDGEQQAVNVDNGTIQRDASLRTQTALRIGQRSQGSVFNGGAVQDVRIYARQLSAREVNLLAAFPTLVAYLSTSADSRTKEQERDAFNYYLANEDESYAGLAERVSQLEAEREGIRGRSPMTHIQQERMDSPPMAHILMRGEYDRPGKEVAAATPSALHPMPENAPPNRLGLANWLVDPANPLTARVAVNRFWQEVFGTGIVTTAEDFGVMGSLPTHPELLDTLAVEFQDHRWDVQWLFKTMLMSATYRQSSEVTEDKLERDLDNSLLSRGPRFRMDAEMLRDSALAAGGLLSQKMYGPSVKPYQPEGIWDVVGLPEGNTRIYEMSSGEDLYRRSLYTFWKRMAPPPNLEAFNAPSREVCTVRRERTNTPLQALVTLNDPTFVESARALATFALNECGDGCSAIADLIAERVLARPFTDDEERVVFADQKMYLDYYREHPEDARALIKTGQSEVDDQLDPAQLASWTLVCNQIMNLDEALSK